MSERRAPLQVGRGQQRGTISWAEHVEVHAAYAQRWPEAARRQSPERIVERGGFGWAEVEALLGRPPRSFEPS